MIYNIEGRKIKEIILSEGQLGYSLSIEDWKEGLYLCQWLSKKGEIIAKNKFIIGR